MQCKIENLKPGDTFLDSFGNTLQVERIEPLQWLGIPRTKPKARIYFKTANNNQMFQEFSLSKVVRLVNR